jgi:hypothetical protein
MMTQPDDSFEWLYNDSAMMTLTDDSDSIVYWFDDDSDSIVYWFDDDSYV